MNIKKFLLVFFILLVIVSYNYLNSSYNFDLSISPKDNFIKNDVSDDSNLDNKEKGNFSSFFSKVIDNTKKFITKDKDIKENNYKDINLNNNEIIGPKTSIQDEIKKLAMEDIAFDVETIEQLEDKVSFRDKTRIMQLILTKLTSSDINMFRDIFSDGVTEEEKEQALNLALDRYSEEDLQEIKELYFKYMK